MRRLIPIMLLVLLPAFCFAGAITNKRVYVILPSVNWDTATDQTQQNVSQSLSAWVRSGNLNNPTNVFAHIKCNNGTTNKYLSVFLSYCFKGTLTTGQIESLKNSAGAQLGTDEIIVGYTDSKKAPWTDNNLVRGHLP